MGSLPAKSWFRGLGTVGWYQNPSKDLIRLKQQWLSALPAARRYICRKYCYWRITGFYSSVYNLKFNLSHFRKIELNAKTASVCFVLKTPRGSTRQKELGYRLCSKGMTYRLNKIARSSGCTHSATASDNKEACWKMLWAFIFTIAPYICIAL